jgi:hypothetical protein
MTLTPATPLDFRSFYRREPPPAWMGLCVKRGRRIVAFGLVVWKEHGAACGYFDHRQPVSAFVVHRAAYRILATLREVGEEALYVQCADGLRADERRSDSLAASAAREHPWQSAQAQGTGASALGAVRPGERI